MRIGHVSVVIPARDEEARIGECLRSIRAARTALRAAYPTVRTTTVVALDSCTDDTAAVVATFAEVIAVRTNAGRVGTARRAACEAALAACPVRPEVHWLSCTDADTVVPDQWLIAQLERAARGADLVLGTVVPDPDDISDELFEFWLRHHPAHEDHPFVHGANLGIRASTYLDAGGFAEVAEHEDVQLTATARTVGAVVVSTAAHPVKTSGRHRGRTPGGFAGWLAERLPTATSDLTAGA